MTAPYCRPGCALACPLTQWGHVLDDASLTPPAWRLAFLIVGVPTPLATDQYRECFAAFEAAYGVAELIRGLRLAAEQPTMSGWTAADRARVASLAVSYERTKVAA